MKLLFILMLGLGATFGQADPAAVHGMLLFGHQKAYLSHLPTFHSPHDYQAILEVNLGSDGKALYDKDAATHPEAFYTVVPEKFVLPEMISHPVPFSATLFRGHFERGGIPILEIPSVKITKVIYFTKLNPETPSLSVAKFLIFGNRKEAFIGHLIGHKPNFDQVMIVAAENASVIQAIETQPHARLELPDLADIPLDSDQIVPFRLEGTDVTERLAVLKQIYLELEDLE